MVEKKGRRVIAKKKNKRSGADSELQRYKDSLVSAEYRSLRELKKTSLPWPELRRQWGPLRTLKDLQEIGQQVTEAYLEDWYDWSRGEYAFTSLEAAIEFCRRHERGLVEKCRAKYASPDSFLRAFLSEEGFQVPPRELYPEYAHCSLWNGRKNDVAWFILNPATRPVQTDYEQIVNAFGFGTLWDEYLHEEQVKAGAEQIARDCWCASLRAGRVPAGVPFVHTENFDFPLQPYLFITDQHDGSVRRGLCRVCQGLVLIMFVNEPGFGDSGHYYLSFPREEELPVLNAANYEAYVNSHCGIHAQGRYCCFYNKTKVYSLFPEPGE